MPFLLYLWSLTVPVLIYRFVTTWGRIHFWMNCPFNKCLSESVYWSILLKYDLPKISSPLFRTSAWPHMIVWAHMGALTWKNMTSCLETLENRRGRGSFMLTRITASCRPRHQALASHTKHNLQCLGYYIYNHSDFLFHQSAITDNNPGPHPSEWLCERERSGGSSDFVSSHTVSRGVEMGEMDILPEDPTDHFKKKKKRGNHSFIHTFSLKHAHTPVTNAKKV